MNDPLDVFLPEAGDRLGFGRLVSVVLKDIPHACTMPPSSAGSLLDIGTVWECDCGLRYALSAWVNERGFYAPTWTQAQVS